MEIKQAKKIHHIVMKVLMHTQGIGSIEDKDVIAVKEILHFKWVRVFI